MGVWKKISALFFSNSIKREKMLSMKLKVSEPVSRFSNANQGRRKDEENNSKDVGKGLVSKLNNYKARQAANNNKNNGPKD